MDTEIILVVSLIVISILFVIFVVLVWLHVSQKKSMLPELSKSKTNMADMSYDLNYKQFKQNIADGRAQLEVELKDASFSERENRIRKYYNQELYVYDYSKFENIVDKQLNNLAKKMQVEYPALSQKEVVLSVLYLLEVSDSDICSVLDYSITSLPTVKNRLCKKLNAPHASGLTSFLYNLMVR